MVGGVEGAVKKMLRGFKPKKHHQRPDSETFDSEVEAMELAPPSSGTLAVIQRSTGVDEESHRRGTEVLRAWLRAQPHLPHDLDDVLLGSFIVGCKNSVERAKQSLERYLTNRTTCPDFYRNRDPCDPAFRKMSRVIRYMPLPRMTPEGYRVSVFSLVADATAADIDIRLNAIKVLNSYDVRFLEDPFWAGDVILIDCLNFQLKHLPALTVVPLLKKYIYCVNDTLPVRFRKVIFFNMSPVVETVLALIKPLLKQKIAQRIMATSEDHTFLYNHVPKDVLPEEYGGKAGKLDELNGLYYQIKEGWQAKVESYREWFLKDMRRQVDRPRQDRGSHKHRDQLFGAEGSFRALSID